MSKRLRILTSAALVFAFILPVQVRAIGNDFDGTDWRVDLVSTAHNYGVLIEPAVYQTNWQVPPYAPDFTTAWISADLTDPGQTGGNATFTQTGVMSRKDNAEFWFVYTEAGVTCLRGAPTNPDPNANRGCEGSTDDLVGLGTVTIFQFAQLDDGYWYAIAYEQPNYTLTLLARINWASPTIYDAQVTAEEGYNEPSDPHLPFLFGLNHPGYSPTGAYLNDWPGSAGQCTNPLGYTEGGNGNDCLFTEFLADPSQSLCPSYIGGTMAIFGDSRLWYEQSGGQTCIYTFP